MFKSDGIYLLPKMKTGKFDVRIYLNSMCHIMLNFAEYIKIFKEECGEHLSENEASQLDALFAGGAKEARSIFLKLEELRTSGQVPSTRFEKTLTDFYWRFAY